MSVYMSVFLVATIVTAVVTPICIKVAPKIGAMDVPRDKRRMHGVPMPRFGGFAIYCGVLITFLRLSPFNMQTFGLCLGATLILILGIIDDIFGMPAKVKLLGQIACAIVLYFFTIQIRGMSNPLPIGERYLLFPEWLAILVTVLWIVGITNTINLIDGLDGLAAGISCIACISVAYMSIAGGRSETALLAIGIAGATFGFLFYNFHPAKIFMGDAGSMLLGYLLASVSLLGDSPTKYTTLFATLIPIIILGLPIFDTAFAIIRRVVQHKPIMQADKGHLHHRIMAMGFGQRRTVLALYSISAIMGVAGILWTMSQRIEALVLAIIAATLISIFLGIGIVDKNQDGVISKDDIEASSGDVSDDASGCAEDNKASEEI